MTDDHDETRRLHKGTVLLVDDEAYVRDSLATLLERRGFRVQTAPSVAAARGALDGLDALVVDLKMPGEGGEVLVAEVAGADGQGPPVVVMTGHGTVASAVACMKAGAHDYLLKPTDADELGLVLERAIADRQRRRELAYLRAERSEEAGRDRPLGDSAGWRQVLELVELAAPADTSVLLLGESGTGKEEAAKLLHRLSPRRGAAFVRVNCAAVPPELFESEFFGHKRGAFTGAVADRDGRFRVADGGTLLLDEIDALPPAAQAKVLRVLQDGEFERVGESRPTRVDVRLVCATNSDLEELVAGGRFRADLYYRVAVMTVSIPPLRERREDVAILAKAFLGEMSRKLGKAVHAIHPAAMAAMEAYHWPGNVRELRNVIERGVLLARSDELRASDLPFAGDGAAEPPPPGEELHLRRTLEATERRLLAAALRRAEGVRREAARLLGIDERNLAYYLKKHGLMERER